MVAGFLFCDDVLGRWKQTVARAGRNANELANFMKLPRKSGEKTGS
jgi:hypothetical protein